MLSKLARTDRQTAELLAIDKRIADARAKGDTTEQESGLEELLALVRRRGAPATSRDRNLLFQAAMIYASSWVLLRSEGRRDVNLQIKAVVVHYDRTHPDETILTPCHFGQAQTSTQHLRHAPDSGDPCGVYRRSAAKRSVLRCPFLEECPQSIRLVNAQTTSILCLPILETDDLKEPEPQIIECEGIQSVHCSTHSSVAVADKKWPPILVLESTDKQAFAALDEPTINELKRTLIEFGDRLKQFTQHRDTYKALRACNTLLEISRQDLHPSNAYRSLLSAARRVLVSLDARAAEADMTLHLREGFDGDAQAVNLIAVSGKRERSHVVGDRTNIGLVGETVLRNKEKSIRQLDREQIEQERPARPGARSENPRYREVLPHTKLEICVPLLYPNCAPVGALNVEWREGSTAGDLPVEEQRALLSKLTPMLKRIASYLTMVVDHFDDMRTVSSTRMEPLEGERDVYGKGEQLPTRLQSYLQHRYLLAYHAALVLKRIRQTWLAREATDDEKASDGSVARSFPELELIQAHIGHLVLPEYAFRRRVTVRVADPISKQLLEALPKASDVLPLPLESDHLTVLPNVWRMAIPLFGRIEANPDGSGRHMVLDRSAMQLIDDLPEGSITLDRAQVIPYFGVTTTPIYEIGLPLIAGGDVIGVLDLELFSRKPLAPGQARPQLAESLDRGWLLQAQQWGRFISFAMCYSTDARGAADNIEKSLCAEGTDYHEFLSLCGQLIAGAPISDAGFGQFVAAMASDITSIESIHFELEQRPSSVVAVTGARAANTGAELSRAIIAGHSWIGRMVVTPTPDTATPAGMERRQSLNATMADFLQSAYLIRHWVSPVPPVLSGFDEAIRVAKLELESILPEALKKLEVRSVRSALDVAFQTLHDVLQRTFHQRGEGARHGWKLYGARRSEDGGRALLTCAGDRGPWVYFDTPEFKELVNRLSTFQGYGVQTIAEQVFGGDVPSAAAAHSVLKAEIQESKPETRLRQAALAAFSAKSYDWPKHTEDTNTPIAALNSITAFVAHDKQMYTSPDVVRSALFSEGPKYPFESVPYSIAALPIVLRHCDDVRAGTMQDAKLKSEEEARLSLHKKEAGDIVGVLNVFRRRDVYWDLSFFQIDKLDPLRELVTTFERILEATICIEELSTQKPDVPSIPEFKAVLKEAKRKVEALQSARKSGIVYVVSDVIHGCSELQSSFAHEVLGKAQRFHNASSEQQLLGDKLGKDRTGVVGVIVNEPYEAAYALLNEVSFLLQRSGQPVVVVVLLQQAPKQHEQLPRIDQIAFQNTLSEESLNQLVTYFVRRQLAEGPGAPRTINVAMVSCSRYPLVEQLKCDNDVSIQAVEWKCRSFATKLEQGMWSVVPDWTDAPISDGAR